MYTRRFSILLKFSLCVCICFNPLLRLFSSNFALVCTVYEFVCVYVCVCASLLCSFKLLSSLFYPVLFVLVMCV